MTTQKPLTIQQNAAWQAQAKQEAMDWHKAKGAFQSDRDSLVYSFAFDAGWQQAVKTLKLQGMVRS